MPSGGEILVILVLVLLLFGPDKLPDLARQLGRGVRELNRMKNNLQSQFNLLDDDEPLRRPNSATSSTRNAALPNAPEEHAEETNGWESYATRQAAMDQTEINNFGRNDFGRDENKRDEDDRAEDFAEGSDDGDWRRCDEELDRRTTKAENSANAAQTFDNTNELPASSLSVARASRPNRVRPEDEAI